jgi:hypothetical protein
MDLDWKMVGKWEVTYGGRYPPGVGVGENKRVRFYDFGRELHGKC